MKRGSTTLLKAVILLSAIGALSVCLILAPELAREDAAEHPETAYLKYPFLAGVYITAAPFFLALYQALKLARNIDNNQTFSPSSVQILKNIKLCAVAVSALLALGLVSGIILARGTGEDITGVVMLGLILTFATSVIATFAAVLQKLLQNAVDIKSENDATV